MASEALGEKLFEDMVTAILQDVTKTLLPGSQVAVVLAKHAGRALYRILTRARPSEQQAEMDGLSRMPHSRSWDIAARRVAATDLPEDEKTYLVRYLSAIPMSSRQALHRWNDGGHVTTLLSQLPRTEDEMARFMPIRAPHFKPGDRIANHDLCLEMLLGQGGFAEVWKARNPVADRRPPVALKFCLEQDLVPSLKREIDLLGQLQGHESGKDFVQLLQTAYSADPPFLVYEYVDGGNLVGWLESFDGRAPAPADVIAVLKMTARAVAVAHDSGIVHRDLKPSNLLVTQDGRVKVTDFGIGAAMAEFEARHQGEPGGAVGDGAMRHGAYTPMYSDPLRDRFAAADPRDDVYAMGVIAYQLLMGNATYTMQGAWRRHLDVRGVTSRLAEVVEICVAPVDQRFANAGALLAALERLREPEPPKQREGRQDRARSTAVRYCHQCGTRVKLDNLFCTGCGHRYPGGAG